MSANEVSAGVETIEAKAGRIPEQAKAQANEILIKARKKRPKS